jgi:sugar phosphate isomerase/epimerase
MKTRDALTRRSFLGSLASAPLGAALAAGAASKHIPIGLELYSVRDELAKDLPGTVEKVAKMGYQCVEFYAPYYDWTSEYAKQVRKQLDTLGIRCYSTHNDAKSFTPEGIGKAMELNHILGTRYIVLASPPEPVKTIDGWKQVAELLNKGNHTMRANGFHAAYHNDDDEWKPLEGQKPIEVVAHNTEKSVMLQLDTGNCSVSGGDPLAWIKSNPGRIHSMHVKDWSPEKGSRVLLGEGVLPWKKIFAAAESVGGIEYYLIEQEGSQYSQFETVKRCLAAYRKLHG